MNKWLVVFMAIVPRVFIIIAVMPAVFWQKYEFEMKLGDFKMESKKSLWRHETEDPGSNTTVTGNIMGDSEDNICSEMGKSMTNCCDHHRDTQMAFVGGISCAGVVLLLSLVYLLKQNKLILHAYAFFAVAAGACVVTTIALWDEHMGKPFCGHEYDDIFDKQVTSLELGFIAAAVGAGLYLAVGFASFYYAVRRSPLPGINEDMITTNPMYNVQSLVF